ncbi:hypothetical protein DY000_02060779 [Brassica cretica]|uniref:Uncharacterized protein n=1 Tax=Brassica cretica TaxID=69181 RepID=A0ABQ7ANW6_BRACR|nr:hypothetical protein DY000_02060779 [Brassica cretica]
MVNKVFMRKTKNRALTHRKEVCGSDLVVNPLDCWRSNCRPRAVSIDAIKVLIAAWRVSLDTNLLDLWIVHFDSDSLWFEKSKSPIPLFLLVSNPLKVRVPLINCTLVPLNCPMIRGSDNQLHSRAIPNTLDPSITSYPGVKISKQL